MLRSVRLVAEQVPSQTHAFDLRALDPYRPLVDDEDRKVHEAIDALLDGLDRDIFAEAEQWAQEVAEQGKDVALQYVRAIVPRLMAMDLATRQLWEAADRRQKTQLANYNLRPRALRGALSKLMRRKLPLTEEDLLGLLEWFASYDLLGASDGPIASVLRSVSAHVKEGPLPAEFQAALRRILDAFDEPDAADRRIMAQIVALLGED